MKLLAVGVEPVAVVAIGAAPTGVIAIGQLATGVIAVGQLARGVIAVGQLAVGIASLGQLGLGYAWAAGQLAVGATTGAAMLPLSPFGRVFPWRWCRRRPLWRERRLPGSGPGWLLAAAFLVATGVVVALVAVEPVWDALTRPGGVFRPQPPGMRG